MSGRKAKPVPGRNGRKRGANGIPAGRAAEFPALVSQRSAAGLIPPSVGQQASSEMTDDETITRRHEVKEAHGDVTRRPVWRRPLQHGRRRRWPEIRKRKHAYARRVFAFMDLGPPHRARAARPAASHGLGAP